jgi:hypothetical protein
VTHVKEKKHEIRTVGLDPMLQPFQ